MPFVQPLRTRTIKAIKIALKFLMEVGIFCILGLGISY